ncbi:hypothetical protein T484DRAFT_1779848 [Baffinella frigidus]|nr:hypothetical protein T484DRAFT_1779848 [Cryptophyta sp. CCMP2293]
MSGRRSHGADTDGKMAEIREWVEGLGGPTSPAVPALSDASLAYLQRLSTASKARDGLNRRLAAEARRQGASQEAEATRAVAILERCSLHFDRWDPRSGDMKRVVQGQFPYSVGSCVETLADSAIALDTKDASLNRLCAAVSRVDADLAAAEDAKMHQDAGTARLRRESAASLALLEKLQRIEEDFLARVEHDEAAEGEREQALSYLTAKQNQYKAAIGKYREELRTSGVSEEIYHARLILESEHVRELQPNPNHSTDAMHDMPKRD